MPTIKNISGATKKFLNKKGNYESVADQGSLESYFPYRAVAEKIQITDVEPFFNPVVARSDDKTGTTFNVSIDSDADFIMIYTDAFIGQVITMVRGASDGTPVQSILPGKPLFIDVKKFDCGTTLYFAADTAVTAGQVIIEQYQNEPY